VLALPGEGLKPATRKRASDCLAPSDSAREHDYEQDYANECEYQHNVDEELLCDWIEATVLFHEPSLSGAELVDLLTEQQYYTEQASAWQLFDMLYFRLQQRAQVLGEGYPLKLTHRLIESRGAWQEFLPYSFCLTLSLAKPFAGWAAGFGTSYTEQGALFEQLSARSLGLILPGWSIYRTGWAATHATKLKDIVRRLAISIGATVGNLDDWVPEKTKDAELDLACVREFPDPRGGHCTFLTQCASGKNWSSKLHTPNLALWSKLINFTVPPDRCFTIPYTLPEKEFRISTLKVQGLFLDRLRLLTPGRASRDWIPRDLSVEIERWVAGRLRSLPKRR